MAKLNSLIKQNGNDIYTFSVLNGIDTSNVLATNPPLPYTAQQDCYVCGYFNTNHSLNIDGVSIIHLESSIGIVENCMLKKGQTLSITQGTYTNMSVYGIKR